MTAAEVVMYSTPLCGYCSAAKRLLRKKGVEFTDINVMFDRARRTEMTSMSGRRTVPQIFIGDIHVGGYDDLDALERKGELDRLLSPASAPDRQQGDETQHG